MHKLKVPPVSIVLVLALLLAAGPSMNVFAQPLGATDPGLGTAANASILSATLLTNTGSSSTNIDVDVYPLAQVAPVGLLIGGAFHSADGVAQQVQADALAADLNMLGQALTSNQGPALDGLTLVPGVYDIGAGQLNGGVLTLDGPGIYIFRASSSLVSSGSINFINGARACDLYWHVQTLATINGSSFAGTIIAGSGIHFGNSVTLDGRALAIGGDVTLINNTITGPSCAAVTPIDTPVGTPVGTAVVGISTTTVVPTTEQETTVRALPNTGGAPIRNEEFPWSLVIIGGFTTIALVFGIRTFRRTRS